MEGGAVFPSPYRDGAEAMRLQGRLVFKRRVARLFLLRNAASARPRIVDLIGYQLRRSAKDGK